MDIETALRGGWVFLTALGGALTSLYSQDWKKMGWPDRILSVCVAMSFSLFAFPWIASTWLGWSFGDMQAAGGVSYLGAAGAHIFVPRAIMFLRKRLGGEEEAR